MGRLCLLRRALGVGPGLAGAPIEVGLFCECDPAGVGTLMLLSGLPLISGAKLLLLSLVSYVPGTDAGGGIATATTIGCRVMHGGCAGAATAGGWCEAACAEGVEKVEGERIFFRGEIEDPQDVNYSEDEPAGCECIERGKV